MKLTKRAQEEVEKHGLANNPAYLERCKVYRSAYERRPPHKSIPAKNMIRALRMCTYRNTADDWARLHITEAYLRQRK